jgi:hypothetical protein
MGISIDCSAERHFWAIAAFAAKDIGGGITAHTLPMTRTESSEIFIYDVAVRSDIGERVWDAAW